MQKQIETRIARLEARLPASDGCGITNMTRQEIELNLHSVRAKLVACPETPEETRERLRQDMDKQEEAVRSQLAFLRRPDIADSIARNRAAGFVGYKDRNTIDWEALAEVWGIT